MWVSTKIQHNSRIHNVFNLLFGQLWSLENIADHITKLAQDQIWKVQTNGARADDKTG